VYCRQAGRAWRSFCANTCRLNTGTTPAPDAPLLLDEIGRCATGTKDAYTDGARVILDEIADRLAPQDPQSAYGKALALYTMAVGTLQLSRALSDPKFADEVLEQGIQNALVFLR
jgi:hypothetical protein